MKTAISIPDDLFQTAEQFAQEHGLSRSELYASALRHYLQIHSAEQITEQLNAIYSTESNSLDPRLARRQRAALSQDDW